MTTHVETPKRRGFPSLSRRTLVLSGLALVVIIAGGFIWFLFQPSKDTTPAGGVPVGQAAPNFTLTELHGGSLALSSLRGHPVIINFWASYCAPCQDEMPLLNSFYQQYQGKGLVILGINEGEPMATISDYAQRYKITYQVLADPSYQFNADSSYDPTPLPRSYFIDKQGVVRAVFTGELSPSALQANYQKISG
jgi:thiol-disulfide isomerase/thioredoxin